MENLFSNSISASNNKLKYFLFIYLIFLKRCLKILTKIYLP